MGVWLNVCDAKKVNSNYRFLEKQEYFDSVNRNKHNVLTKAINKQTASFL